MWTNVRHFPDVSQGKDETEAIENVKEAITAWLWAEDQSEEGKMSGLQEAEKLLAGMPPGEKAQILQWLVQDIWNAFPGIEDHPNVCGGVPCVIRTRIPVWVLIQARLSGISDAELLRCYPTLRAEDLTNAWGYYRAHRDEISRQIIENDEE